MFLFSGRNADHVTTEKYLIFQSNYKVIWFLFSGHNADDIAETVIMNVLRGDVARLQRCTAITTGDGSEGVITRSVFREMGDIARLDFLGKGVITWVVLKRS